MDNKFNFLTHIKNRLQDLFGPKEEMISPVPLDVSSQPQAPSPTPTPTPQPGEIPGGTDLAMDFLQRQIPQSTTPQEYFPAMQDQGFMDAIVGADQKRQGLSNLLLLMGLLESTLGKGSDNIFGTLPPGGREFSSPSDAVEYQLGPSVLGGGGSPNMNILDEQRPLTIDDVMRLYEAYNPSGSYNDILRGALTPDQ